MNQLQFTDSMTVFLLQTIDDTSILINVGAFTLAILVNLYFLIRHHQRDPWRILLNILSIALAGWMIYGYWQIVTAGASNTAVFRLIQPGWATLIIAVPVVTHTVISSSPSEQVRRELAEAKHTITNLEQGRIIYEGVMSHYQETMTELEIAAAALKEKHGEDDKLIRNLRSALANMAEDNIKAKEVLMRAKFKEGRG